MALFAAFALIGGGASVVGALQNRRSDEHWWLALLLGLVSIGAGVIAIIHPDLTALVLVLLMGANAIATGILDIALAQGSGLELLPDLRSRHGAPIPVIVFSVQDAESDNDQVEATLNKARTPFRSFVAAGEDRLALRSSRAFREVA